MHWKRKQLQDFRLYVILDEELLRECANIAEIARMVIAGGADILQLRAKSCSDRKILKIACDIKALTTKNKILFLLNDRVDLVQAIDCDGVHLGQEDLPLKEARRLLGKNKIIGISTHRASEAIEAKKQKADYIALGPIFPTATKPLRAALTAQIIPKVNRNLSKDLLPLLAIGGINLDNLEQVLAYGASRVAICRAIITAKDIVRATKEFKQRLSKITARTIK